MDSVGCATIDECKSVLNENLSAADVEDICDELMSFGLVDFEDNIKINSESQLPKQRIDLLLMHLKHKDNGFDFFLSALDASGHNNMVKCLKEKYKAIKSPVLSSIRSCSSSDLNRWFAKGGVPPIDCCHLPRERLADDVRKALHELRNEDEGWVLIHGAGGMGKTALAVEALRNDALIKDFYPGGVFWFSIGKDVNQEDGSKLLVKMQVMVTALCLAANVPRQTVSYIEEAQYVLRMLVNEKLFLVLLVLDDLWNPDVATLFNIGARILVTSRQANIGANLGVHVNPIEVNNGFTIEESGTVFRNWLRLKSNDQLPERAKLIWSLVNGNPLAIGMIGALVLRHGDKMWQACADKLKSRQNISPADKHTTLHDAVGISIDYIEEESKRENYYRLAVFDDDVYLSIPVLSILWQMEAAEDATILMEEFVDLSLATRIVTSGNQHPTYALHDLQLDVIKSRCDSKLPQIHKQLLNNYLKVANGDWCNLPNDGYIHWFLAQHLKRANDTETLVDLYTNLRFIQSKLQVTGPGDIINDLYKYRCEFDQHCRQNDWEHFRVFMQSHAHQLASHVTVETFESPDFVQLALCQPEYSPVYQQAVQLASELSHHRVFWQWKNRAQADNQLVWSQLATQTQAVMDTASIGYANDEVKSVDVLRDKLLVGCSNGALLLLNITNGQEICTFPLPINAPSFHRNSSHQLAHLVNKSNIYSKTSAGHSSFRFFNSQKVEHAGKGDLKSDSNRKSKLSPCINDSAACSIVKATFTVDGESFFCCSQITEDDEEVGCVSFYKIPPFTSQTSAMLDNEVSLIPDRVVDHCWHPQARIGTLKVPCRRLEKQRATVSCDTALICSKRTSAPVTCCAAGTNLFLVGLQNGDIERYTFLDSLYCSGGFPKHDGSVQDLHISECGDMFVSAACGSRGTLISVYSLSLSIWLCDYCGHKNAKPTVVRFVPQCSSRIICSAADSELHVWHVENRQMLKKFCVNGDVSILCMDFSSDGKMLAVGNSDYGIKIWNYDSQETLTNFIGHTGFVHAIRFLPSSMKLVSGASDNTLMVWNIYCDESCQTTALMSDFALDTFVDNNDEEHVLLIVQDINWKLKLILDEDIVWTSQHSYNCGVSFAVNCVDKCVAIGFDNGSLLELILSEDLRCVKQERWLSQNVSLGIKLDDGQDQALRCVHYHQSDGFLLACGDPGPIDVYNKDGKNILRFTVSQTTRNCVKALFFRAGDSSALAAVWKDGTLAAWSFKDGDNAANCLFKFSAHSDTIFDLDVSPDHSFLVTGAADKFAKLFSLPSGQLIHLLPNKTRGLRVCRFSPVLTDRRLVLATGGDDGRVLLWQVAPQLHANSGFTDLAPTAIASSDSTWVTDLCWTKDGRALAVASDSVRLCRPSAVQSDKVCVFHVRGSTVRLVRMTPSGRRLVTIDSAGTLYWLEKVVAR